MPNPAPERNGAVGGSASLGLVAGLGNPGREYEDTRHNIGFLVLDRLATQLALPAFAFSNSWQTLWTRSGDGVLYLKPMTFMNLSGRAVGAVVKFYKIPAENLLIVYDDVALPLGRLRLRPGGSAGGHNGMQSVIDHLGTPVIPRLRVGIGAATGGGSGMVGHVLGRFRPDERDAVAEAVQRAVDAVETIQRQGWEAAMNLYNRPPSLT